MSQPKQGAPGPLELVRAFVNTGDVESAADAIADPRALEEWLVANDLLHDWVGLSDADARRAIEFREGLRALMLANAGHELDPSAVENLNVAGRNARLVVRFDGGGSAILVPDAAGLEAALARMLGIVVAAMGDGTWPRLKACLNETCMWAFYDRSKNRSGRWCTMEVCGNVMKARTYRKRHAEEGAPG